MVVTPSAIEPLKGTTRWWAPRKDVIPAFSHREPYTPYLWDRTLINVLDTDKHFAYINGMNEHVDGLTEEKMKALHMLDVAHRLFWKLPHRHWNNRRDVCVSHIVTSYFTNGLWKDILYPLSNVVVNEWKTSNLNVGNGVKQFCEIELQFPSNYIGAFTSYLVVDRVFTDRSTSFVMRTIEPRPTRSPASS